MLKIAEMLIEINPEGLFLPEQFECFSTEMTDIPLLVLNFKESKSIAEPGGQVLLDERFKWIKSYKGNKEAICCVHKELDESKFVSMLKADKKLTDADILVSAENLEGKDLLKNPLIEMLFRCCIVQHDGLVIHAAAVVFEGKGILLCAPKGGGKSTQASLWKKHKNAVVINGDRPTVRMVGSEAYVYGTPWSGSSLEYLNAYAPLRAIVMIEKSGENAVDAIDKSQALTLLMPRCFLPYHDRALMDKALDTLERIISNTPVFVLKGRPEKEAVEMVYKCII